ncbi:SpoIIE family protein phosphatase [candidate division KSB1 bacterium]|nr:SpoIIE family protein phosphatase [candidate division KSB1 bacterium]
MAPKTFIFFLLLALEGVKPAISEGEIGLPFITNYTPREYQASNQNWSIVQDTRGILYIANGKGVLEFDGSTWRLFPLANNAAALSVAAAEDNTIYVGGKGEIGYLKPDSSGTMSYHSLIPLIQPEDRNFGDVWETIVFDQYVFFRSAEQLLQYRPLSQDIKTWQPKSRFHFSFKVKNELFIRQPGHGLYRLADDSLQLVPGGDIFSDISIAAFLPIAVDTHLVITPSGGFYSYSHSRFQALGETPTQKFIKQNRAIHAIKLKNHLFALATDAGVLFVEKNGDLLHLVNKAAGLRDEMVWYLYQDDQGGLWCALNNGLARIEFPSPLTFFDERHGLDGVAQDMVRHDDQLYLALSPGGVCMMKTRQTSGEPLQPTFVPVQGIMRQSWKFVKFADQLLVAATDGIYEINGSTAKKLLPQIRDLEAAYLFVPPDHPHLLFVGLFNGLAILTRQQQDWTLLSRVEQVEDEIRHIIQDTTGALWLGTRSNGLYRLIYTIEPDLAVTTVQHFSTAEGLPAGQVFPYLIHDQLVFTTENRGLLAFNEKTGRFFPQLAFGQQYADGSIDVEMVAQNDVGTILWFGSEESGRVHQLIYNGTAFQTTASALNRVPRSAVRALYPDEKDVLWISTNEGLYRYDMSIRQDLHSEYSTLLRQVFLLPDSLLFGGSAFTQNAPPLISHRYNGLRFEFSAARYEVDGLLEYQTRLDGFDKFWSNWTPNNWKEYTNLSPGYYQFRVRAKNIYDHVSNEAHYSFRLLPPLYRTRWAYGFYLLLLAALVFGVDRFQRRRLMKKARERTRFALLEAENQRKSEELEKARQLQISMLPTELPKVSNATIAVFMKTAAEVGGDYYDFIHKDGELIGTIGDATGHGLNAGMMVSITKGFFISEAADLSIVDFFQKCNKALKQMRLNRIYMALTVYKLQGNRMQVSSAGMPPIYLYRSTKNQFEEMTLRGMPLGAVLDFPYETKEVELQSGDILFFMSDGFPELFNIDNEIIGYTRIPNILKNLAHKAPGEIIVDLVEYSKEWAEGRQIEDDMTFVVIKMN